VIRWGLPLWLGLCLVHGSVRAATSVEVRCSELDPEHAAAFEARAHTELLVRGLSGSLRLDCSLGPRLEWTPSRGSARATEAEAPRVEALLAALATLLESEPPAAETPADRPPPPPPPLPAAPPPRADLRAGAHGRLWGGQGALGVEILLGVPIAPLTLTASGNLTRGRLSYGNVSLYVLETRTGAEVLLLDSLRLAAGVGAGRPFTTETATITRIDASQNLWFVEGFLRAAYALHWSRSWRLELGAESALFSRPVRLVVDGTRAYDFAWQPGVFLQAAFELR
jgi:hypothetical protein